MKFSDEQNKALNVPLDLSKVKTRKKSGRDMPYVEGWQVMDRANAIFGFDGWSRETLELIENTDPTKNRNGNWVVSFRAKVQISAGGKVRQGIGFGSGISSDIHDAYEGAIKEAETDAMKRALVTFGDAFGLILYDKDNRHNRFSEAQDKKPKQQAPKAETPFDASSDQDDMAKELGDLIATIEQITTMNNLQGLWATARLKKFWADATDEQRKELDAAKNAKKATLEMAA